ncbi:MAG: glycoside hydrolase family 15 protein [Longimicrobiales bacterium]
MTAEASVDRSANVRSAVRPAPIDDYAIIGDCRCAALVSRHGSIDWFCCPRFDSGALFAALLDRARGGRFSVRPAGRYLPTRAYLPGTNLLEMRFEAAGGVLRLVDFMPVASESDKNQELWAEHQILRRLECTAGEVEVEILCDPRPDFDRFEPRVRRFGADTVTFDHGKDVYVLRGDGVEWALRDDGAAHARLRLHAGERAWLSLSAAHEAPGYIPVLGEQAERRLEQSARWWRLWCRDLRYDGDFEAAVLRSALVLKLMTYAPSGAVVAAPTTSLPEHIGGDRNWDYRYCWLRDASLTVRAFLDLGFTAEGQAFASWILHATRRTWPEIRVLYDVYGEVPRPECELAGFDGYAGSRPVRLGNAAAEQFQLDTYGEVIDAVFRFVERGGAIDRTERKLLRGLGETICKRWREPDHGVWEIRGDKRQYTFSKAISWVGLDRLLWLNEHAGLDIPRADFMRERDALRAAIETRSWNERLQSYVDEFDGDQLDASLLLLGECGYLAADDERYRSTCRRVRERLEVNGLLYRYEREDDLPGREGAFGICSFWNAESYALTHDVETATSAFAAVLARANDVGLFGEQVDPESGRALGNFPQAFTHVGLIDAALAIEQARANPSAAGR